jgi:lysophospholipase L1-like esterase
MRRPLSALTLALALWLLLPGAPPAHAEPPGCGAPPETLEAMPLAGTFAAVARGELRILVVGSAVTGGAASEAAAWPQRLEAILATRLAPVVVRVVSNGVRGTTAADHARVIAAEAPRYRPHLIIWQLGTVEAVRGTPAEEMSDAVQEAAARLRAARGELTDLVLMDMQFSRFLRANSYVDAYRDQLRIAAAASGAQLFSRWAIMKHWAETDRLDLERARREQRAAMTDEMNDCLARALSVFVLEGVGRNRR